jgi:hypothetical protein
MKLSLLCSGLTSCVLFCNFLIVGLYPFSVHAEELTLKDKFFIQEAVPLKKAQACDKVFSVFKNQELDRFTSNSSRVLGLDLHGKIWEVKKKSSGTCAIENIARLGIAAPQKNSTGEIEQVVFYYEPDSVCAYSQSTSELRPVRRLCYQPIGIVNKFAPYKSP